MPQQEIQVEQYVAALEQRVAAVTIENVRLVAVLDRLTSGAAQTDESGDAVE